MVSDAPPMLIGVAWTERPVKPVSHFTLVFVGARRQFRVVLAVAYAVFGGLSLTSLAALVNEPLRGFAG